MDLLANPKSYNIAFSVASLLLVAVTLVIDRSEEAHNNRQKQIFGMIIFDAAILCTAGFLHNIWVFDSNFHELVDTEMNIVFVLV